MAMALVRSIRSIKHAVYQHGVRFTPRQFSSSFESYLNDDLENTDPELFAIIEDEKTRQRDSFCLIASEVAQQLRTLVTVIRIGKPPTCQLSRIDKPTPIVLVS